MKYDKHDVKKYIISALTLVVSVVLMDIVYINLPKAITYEETAKADEKEVISKTYVVDKTVPCPYKSAADIRENGKFEIMSIDDSIYVMQNDVCLYKLSCSLYDFPEADIQAIMTGIQINNRNELLEVVAYMES